MGDPRLLISLDEGCEVRTQGAMITGEVTLVVPVPITDGELALVCEGTEDGRACARSEASRTALARGPWRAGEHRHRFACEAPLGPICYEGETLRVGWRVLARASLGAGRSLETRAEFRLIAAPNARLDDPYCFGPGLLYVPEGTSERYPWLRVSPSGGSPERGEARPWAVVWIVSGIVAALVALAALGWARWSAAGVLAIASMVAIVWAAARIVEGRRVTPGVRVSPRVTCPGGAITVALSLAPTRAVEVVALVVELLGEETTEGGHRPGAHRIATETRRVVEERHLGAGERLEAEVTFELPADAPCTYVGERRRVEWSLRVRTRARPGGESLFVSKVVVRPGSDDGSPA